MDWSPILQNDWQRRIKLILKQSVTSKVMTRCLEGFLSWCGLLGATKETMVWQKADKTADISCYLKDAEMQTEIVALPPNLLTTGGGGVLKTASQDVWLFKEVKVKRKNTKMWNKIQMLISLPRWFHCRFYYTNWLIQSLSVVSDLY